MPPTSKEALKKFSDAAEEFANAADKLLLAWERLDPDLSADVARSYPFHKDFMELLGDIHGWKHVIRRMVKMGWPGPREWLPRGRKES